MNQQLLNPTLPLRSRRAALARPRLTPLLFILLASATATSLATIPEPDNILYGNITLGSATVTSAMTNVVIEARRTANGPAIASYRMGSDPQVGNYYSLKIPVESVAPILGTNASQTGDALVILLRDLSGIRAQTNFTIAERGFVQRLDFGMAVADSDQDGLPDEWELLQLGHLGQTPGGLTTNGQTVLTHFIAGTDPTDPNAGFRLRIELTNNLKRVWFIAARAEGPGYTGLRRLYTLQYRPVLNAGFWTDVPGYIAIEGTNQTVNYFTANVGLGYYRGCILLEGFNLPDDQDRGLLLTIRLTAANTAIVEWPSPSTGFSLQENANLNTTNWVLTPNPISDDGTNKYIIVNPAVGARFYRLFKP